MPSAGEVVRSLPEPHPLDFDWRYNSETILTIADIVPLDGPIISIGTPSLARHFSRLGRDVTLVDRQPFQYVDKLIVTEIDSEPSRLGRFRTSIVDPPWYPSEAKTWIAWAAHCVGENGVVLATIWSPETRPNAKDEFCDAVDWMKEWADVKILDYLPIYEMPLFERLAIDVAKGAGLSSSPRVGCLLQLRVRVPPPIPALPSLPEEWIRFIFNDYQIAVRQGSNTSADAKITPHPGSYGWRWPFVSRRAPQRNLIDVWSSRNEVAIASGTSSLVELLRKLSSAKDIGSYEIALESVPELADWQLPRPPYWRTFEWFHRQ